MESAKAGGQNVRRIFALVVIALAFFSLIPSLGPDLSRGWTAAQSSILGPVDADCGNDGSPAVPRKGGAHTCQSLGLCCFVSSIEAPTPSFATTGNSPYRTALIVSNATSTQISAFPTWWATAWSSRAPPSA